MITQAFPLAEDKLQCLILMHSDHSNSTLLYYSLFSLPLLQSRGLNKEVKNPSKIISLQLYEQKTSA